MSLSGSSESSRISFSRSQTLFLPLPPKVPGSGSPSLPPCDPEPEDSVDSELEDVVDSLLSLVDSELEDVLEDEEALEEEGSLEVEPPVPLGSLGRLGERSWTGVRDRLEADLVGRGRAHSGDEKGDRRGDNSDSGGNGDDLAS